MLESIPIAMCFLLQSGPKQELMQQEAAAKMSQAVPSETTPGKVAKKQRLGAPESSGAEHQLPPAPKKLFEAGQNTV